MSRQRENVKTTVPEVLYNICNMCGWDLPDMYALACALGLMLHIRQIPPAHITYITYLLL